MSADVVVIGAGPAGLSLATALAEAGASVEIVDEQPLPGGQIYRAAERNDGAAKPARWLGEDYAKGAPLVARARAQAGIKWRMGAAVWDIRCESDHVELGLVEGEQVSVVRARHVALAGGAMERPTPFPGWTLPGVVTIGAAQTLLKDAALLPEDGVVLAGQGPLLYLFAIQLLDAGVRPAALLGLRAALALAARSRAAARRGRRRRVGAAEGAGLAAADREGGRAAPFRRDPDRGAGRGPRRRRALRRFRRRGRDRNRPAAGS